MRNKRLADAILIILLISFIIITLFRRFVFNGFIMELISFIIEAALVGGIADWFAVTALFRKPLGFSWHTAIIPKNKEKVIEAIASVVEKELLSYEAIQNKIKKLNIIDRLIPYLDSFKDRMSLADLFKKYGEGLLGKLDTVKIAENIEELIKNNLNKVNLPVHINNLFDWAIRNNMLDSFLDVLLGQLIEVAEKKETRDGIYNIINSLVKENMQATTGFKRVFLEISFGLAEETNSINISEAADSMQKELIQILTEIRSKDNDLYFKLRKYFEDSIEKLRKDESLSDSVEVWKEDIISQIHLHKELTKLIDEIKDNDTNKTALIKWIEEQLDQYWQSFKEDAKRKNWVDENIKKILYKILSTEHHLIGGIVKDTLNSFTDEALTEFIEGKAGNDLHWIRINGSIVGAIAGAILFLFMELFYDPIVAPVIRNWILSI